MLNIERYRKELENYNASLDCDIHKIRENNEGIRNHLCISKTCPECRKENIEWLLAEYKAPILTEEEKKYLKAVIKPFRDRIYLLRKYKSDNRNNREYIGIFIDDCQTLIDLPDFVTGTSYCGMDCGKGYSLHDLEL